MEMTENKETATTVCTKNAHKGVVDEVNRVFPCRH
jgi:hypothetical protein